MKSTLRLLCSVLLLNAFGCARAPRGKATRPDFQVSVTSGGSAVTDLRSSYIHRLEYAQSALEQLASLPLTVERDRNGGVIGLRVGDGALKVVGLEGGDLITGIGSQRVSTRGDFEALLSAVQQRQESTVTVQRRGAPHKLYLYPKVQ